jgi:hypothetical protein
MISGLVISALTQFPGFCASHHRRGTVNPHSDASQ